MAGFPREYPSFPIIGVGVVVWRDRRVLLVKRGKAPRQGEWSLPGGRQKLGETTREAAAREVREEAGIEVAVGNLLDVVDTITRDPGARADDAPRIRYQFTLVDYDADWVAGETRAGGDAADVVWTEPASLDRYDLWAETKRVILLSAEIREIMP